MTHTFLSALLIVALLGSGNVCAWLCQPGGAAPVAAGTDALPPCHEPAESEVPDAPVPCDEDCGRCGAELAALPGASSADAAQAAKKLSLACSAASRAATPRIESHRVLCLAWDPRVPPRDVLALTTILVI